MVAAPLRGWINGDAAFEFLRFDMPVLRKYVNRRIADPQPSTMAVI
jgi:hypothetical protein